MEKVNALLTRTSFLSWLVGFLLSVMVLGLAFQTYMVSDLHNEIQAQREAIGHLPNIYVLLSQYLEDERKVNNRLNAVDKRIDFLLNTINAKLDEVIVNQAKTLGQTLE